ncbi:MAG: hypothetical protein V3575_04210 [Candidatus Absconditabacteria bacterium]
MVTEPQLVEKYTPIALRLKIVKTQLLDLRSELESKPKLLDVSNHKIFQILIDLASKVIQQLESRNQKDQIYERVVNYTLRIFTDFMKEILTSNDTVGQVKITKFFSLTWNSLIADFESLEENRKSVDKLKDIASNYGVES